MRDELVEGSTDEHFDTTRRIFTYSSLLGQDQI